MRNQRKRVSIPVFDGDKRLYEGWRTAFMACVDKAPATLEYKSLHMNVVPRSTGNTNSGTEN